MTSRCRGRCRADARRRERGLLELGAVPRRAEVDAGAVALRRGESSTRLAPVRSARSGRCRRRQPSVASEASRGWRRSGTQSRKRMPARAPAVASEASPNFAPVRSLVEVDAASSSFVVSEAFSRLASFSALCEAMRPRPPRERGLPELGVDQVASLNTPAPSPSVASEANLAPFRDDFVDVGVVVAERGLPELRVGQAL